MWAARIQKRILRGERMMNSDEVEKRAADVWMTAFQSQMESVGVDMACDKADEAARRFRSHFGMSGVKASGHPEGHPAGGRW